MGLLEGLGFGAVNLLSFGALVPWYLIPLVIGGEQGPSLELGLAGPSRPAGLGLTPVVRPTGNRPATDRRPAGGGLAGSATTNAAPL